MITFKPREAHEGQFEAFINRRSAGLFIAEESAAAAELKLVQLALNGLVIEADAEDRAIQHASELESMALKVAEERDRYEAKFKELTEAFAQSQAKVREHEETIKKMKTVSEAPVKKSIWSRKKKRR